MLFFDIFTILTKSIKLQIFNKTDFKEDYQLM